LDYPSVYYFGTLNDKKPAHPDKPTNNFGYDDERGDYQIINHDHLAYRYEILDTLGKGSFGQVLSCRDHCTGESVAIKIIRNKKRFYHQALVEIKILDNLRKWVCILTSLIKGCRSWWAGRIRMRNTMW
jgi:dual specificity tyrosine-phosphorylation-regulated kinase 2/3/4